MIKYNPPKNIALDIIYCDDSLLIINKPSGLLSVPGGAPLAAGPGSGHSPEGRLTTQQG